MSPRTKEGKDSRFRNGHSAAVSNSHWLLALSFVLALIAYYPTLHYGFVFDDVHQIVENPAVRSWSSLPQYFTSEVWAGVMPKAQGSYYRPLFLIWLRLNYIFFGLSTWGWHLTSLLAHLATIWVLFSLTRFWLKNEIVAGWTALLFAVHPIHVEPVAWVSAIPETLFALFGMAAVYVYLRFRQENRPILLGFAATLYALALLTKETAIVIWPLILIYQWWIREPDVREAGSFEWRVYIRQQAPFAAVTSVYLVLRFIALHGMRGYVMHSWREVACAAPSITWFYLRKLALPIQLAQIYYDPDVWSFSSPHFFVPLIGICLMAAGGAFVALKWKSTRLPILLVTLSLVPPIIGVSVFARHDLVHNRYLYITSAGACILAALLLQKAADPALRFLSASAATRMVVFASFAMILLVWLQEGQYRDNIALFSHAVEVSPQSAMSWGLLGEEYMTQGKNDAGIVAFQRAYTLEPETLTNNYRLGAAYYQVRNMPWAEAYFQRALNTYHHPDVVAYDYCLYRLGLAQYAQGKMPEAEATLRRATSLKPTGAGYHLALGATLKYEGKLAEAKQQFELELQLGPDSDATALLHSIDSGGTAPPALKTITVHPN